jgi:lipopolysaccharide export system protein LptA
MTRFTAAAVAVAAFALAAQAADEPSNPITKGMLNPNAPIDVTADNFVADSNAKTGVYTGNVIVHQGEVRLRANTVRVHVAANKPDKIFAQGNVVFDAPSGVATGDSGVYDVNPRIVTLTGNVVLTKDKNVMRGQHLTINLVTGLATLDGRSGASGRVQALFSPNAKTSENH